MAKHYQLAACTIGFQILIVVLGFAAGLTSDNLRFVLLASAILLAAAWDYLFFLAGDEGVAERSLDDLLKGLVDVRTTLSWFILLFGVTVAFLVTGRDTENFDNVLNNAGIPLWLFFTPLAGAVAGVLFVPVRLKGLIAKGKINDDKPSNAICAHFVFATFVQKVVVVVLLTILVAAASNGLSTEQSEEDDNTPAPVCRCDCCTHLPQN